MRFTSPCEAGDDDSVDLSCARAAVVCAGLKVAESVVFEDPADDDFELLLGEPVLRDFERALAIRILDLEEDVAGCCQSDLQRQELGCRRDVP